MLGDIRFIFSFFPCLFNFSPGHLLHLLFRCYYMPVLPSTVLGDIRFLFFLVFLIFSPVVFFVSFFAAAICRFHRALCSATSGCVLFFLVFCFRLSSPSSPVLPLLYTTFAVGKVNIDQSIASAVLHPKTKSLFLLISSWRLPTVMSLRVRVCVCVCTCVCLQVCVVLFLVQHFLGGYRRL